MEVEMNRNAAQQPDAASPKPANGASDAKGGTRHHLADNRIEWVPIDEVSAYKGNARVHAAKQIRQIADSIRAFGFNNPILVDENRQILAGHGRLEAAKVLGLKKVPTLRISHLSAEEKRAYLLADNRTAELAEWDLDTLATELGDLLVLDFDVELTGFDLDEIQVILGIPDEESTANHGVEDDRGEDDGAEDDGAEDPVLEPDSRAPVSRSGDVWLLGEHRLVCGDASDDSAYVPVDEAVRYWQIFAQGSAILAGTTKTFAEIEEERNAVRHAGRAQPASTKREAA
jgi:ParB-like chromosome segregation protein Spo0J